MSNFDFNSKLTGPVWTKKRTGYAAQPGTGPAGQICKSCAHYTHKGTGARGYPGCGLMRERWTSGPGTDIKAGSPACSRWEAPCSK